MKKIFILLVVIAIFGLGIILWWNNGIAAVNPADKSQKVFVVQKGEGIREIAAHLKNEDLIKDTVVFFLLVKKLGYDNKIQAGDFRLSPSSPAAKIAENLTHGSLDVWVTIPEGKRADEVADILQKNLSTYQLEWRATLDANEGYLFPDTYLIPKDATIDLIVNIMKNNFNNKISQIGLSKDSPSLPQIVIIASLLEREAKGDSEKPVISGIIKNRLDEGMALQVDATIQYAKGKRGNAWWSPVTAEEYKSVVSPYNTYLNPGLPPGPISNPGLASLTAAKNPQKTGYLYYLHDKSGTIRYAQTIDQHNANIRKYGL